MCLLLGVVVGDRDESDHFRVHLLGVLVVNDLESEVEGHAHKEQIRDENEEIKGLEGEETE